MGLEGRLTLSALAIKLAAKRNHQNSQEGWALETEIGIGRKARRAYGLDEIALVPAPVAVDPDDVDVSLKIGDLTLSIPVLASAMDAAV
ncbi:MAG: hypothetical protein LASZOEIN_000716, partial [Candidatus Fervidibacter sp.]